MKYIDLSHFIHDKMPVHPFDEQVKLEQVKFLKRDTYSDSKLECGMHIGTHMDSPGHIIYCDKNIGEYPVDNFCGNAKIFDVRGKNFIKKEDIHIGDVELYDIVLLWTGFDKKFGSKEYFDEHPTVSMDLLDALISKEIKVLGVDLPSPDSYPFEGHKKLFENGVFLVENLTNLEQLIGHEDVEVFFFPLRIMSDGSPIRAVAKMKS